MKWLHNGIGAVTWTGLVMGGIALLLCGVVADGAWSGRLLEALGGAKPWHWMAAGIVVLLWVGLWGLSWALGRRRREFITFENENGRVTVDTEAVRAYLGGLKGEFAAVVWLKSQVRVHRGALAVGLVAGVKEGTQIPETCRMLQARTKEVLAEHLGTCDLAGVAVEINEIRRGGGAM